MKIENNQQAFQVKKWQLLRIIIMITLVIPLVSNLSFIIDTLGNIRYIIAAIILLAYIAIVVYNYRTDPTFFYISDENQKINIRYYSLISISKKRMSIEIPLSSLYKYTTESSFRNKKHSLTLYQKRDKGIAKYPPISISTFSDSERARIYAFLDKYVISGK